MTATLCDRRAGPAGTPAVTAGTGPGGGALGADAASGQGQLAAETVPGSARRAASSSAGAPDSAGVAFRAEQPTPAALLPGGLTRGAAQAAPATVTSLSRRLTIRVTDGQHHPGARPALSAKEPLPVGPRSAAAVTAMAAPRWRGVLEARWQARLCMVTELSVAYHDTEELIRAGQRRGDHRTGRQLRRLLRQAVTARRALADTEEALSRLSAGRYGRCEECAALIPTRRLMLTPEARYCPRCAPEPAMPPF